MERRHGRDRLQEARLAQGSDHHGRLQLRHRVRGRHDRGLLCSRRQDHEARVPAAEHDGLQLLRLAAAPPDQVDGTFWVIGGTGTAASLTAYEQLYGKLDPKKHIGNLFFAFLGADKVVAPKVVGSYVGGFGTAPGLKSPQAKTYEKVVARWYPGLDGGNYADGFVYNYFNAAWAFVQGLTHSKGQVGAALQAGMPRSLRSGYQVSNKGVLKLDSRRQAIQDQWPLQLVKNADGSVSAQIVGFVSNVDQTFGGYFSPSSPSFSHTSPVCKKGTLPWTNRVRVVKNGVVTSAAY